MVEKNEVQNLSSLKKSLIKWITAGIILVLISGFGTYFIVSNSQEDSEEQPFVHSDERVDDSANADEGVRSNSGTVDENLEDEQGRKFKKTTPPSN